MNKRLRLPLALSLALGSTSAFALGLGQIEVKSGLNQPLSAEIPVLSTLSGETDALIVRLAPPEALARVGLPAAAGVAANLEFALDTNSRGQTIIRVTTPNKVNEPFVSFLLEVDWGKGRMLREYTVLLDPPTMASVRTAPIASAPVIEPFSEPEPLPDAPPPPAITEAPSEPAPAATFEPMPEPEPDPVAEAPAEMPEPAPVVEPEPEPAPTRTDTYGPVASGETLWSIAQFARPSDSVSMNQMMLALLHANPDAFIDQNINRLKQGAILRIPSGDEAQAVAAADAAAQVREQMQSWRQASAPVVQPAEPEPVDSPTPRAVATAPTTPESRLELVPPQGDASAAGAQSGASVAGGGRELRAELARNREEVSTLSQENLELKSRVGELEKIQQDSTRLIALKDSELAAAQRRLAELESQEAAAAAAASAAIEPAQPATADAIPSVDTPTDESAHATPTADTATSATDASTTLAEAPDVASAAEPSVPDEAAIGAEPVSSEPAPLADPVETTPPVASAWYVNPWLLGGAVLVFVGLLALILGRRRKPEAVPAPAGRYSSGVLASSVPPKAAVVAPPKVEPVKIDRATELAEAIARAPANLSRHLDLVRHHYDSGDAAGFEHAAEAMYTRVYDPDDMAWKQVVAMGREIAPEHPLFASHEVVAPVIVPVVAPVVASRPAPVPPVSSPREVNWGATPAEADSVTTQQFRLEDVKAAAHAAPPAPVLDLPKVELANELENFSYEPVREVEEPVSEVSESFIDADASSTKLELARAYLDMGDVEGARGMLEEVVSEGNPGQRAEAKRLLDEIR